MRKGSVASFIANATLLISPNVTSDMRREARRDLTELLPALRALEVFEVFEIRDPDLRAPVETHP